MRPDKNKGEAGVEPRLSGAAARPPGVTERTDLAATLLVLKKDLDRLQAFLATYERSEHPDRIESLRWLQPALDRHLRALVRHRQNVQRAPANGS